jgi:hypothetical protein
MRKEVTLLEGGVSGMEIFGLLDQLFHFLAVDFFNLGLCLVGVHRCSNVQLVACVVLNVVTLTHHYNLTQQESNRFKRILSI